MERILLVDGSSLIFRAFYAIRNLTTLDGIPTNAVYGFLSMYYKALEEYKPDYVCVAFDRSGPTLRTQDYEDYKAGREKTPSELSGQFGILKDILEASGIYHVDMNDYEADDILGTIAKKAQDKGLEAICLTGDRDYLQLVDENIKVVLTKKGITNTVLYDEEAIKAEYGISPKQLIDVKGLMGDKSDNIPGVPGVGEKTALKLVAEFGDIDGIYANIENISGKKLTENLIENKDLAYMSKRLGTIFLDVPTDTDLDTFSVKEADYDRLRETFERLEFKTFMAYLPGEEVEDHQADYDLVVKSGLGDLAKEVLGKDQFTFKFFYQRDDYIGQEPFALAVKTQGSPVKIMVFEDGFSPQEAYHGLAGLFESDLVKISFDIKGDLYYLLSQGLDLKNYRDNMIGEYLIDPSRTSYSVEKQASEYLGVSMVNLEEIRGKGAKTLDLGQADRDLVLDYIASYLSLTEAVNPKIEAILAEREMEDLYYKVELPLTLVLADMELEGIHVDRQVLEDINTDLEARLEAITQTIYDLAGEVFNINSSKQLGLVLFDKLGLPVIKKTKTGYSTAQDVLDKLRGEHEIIGHIEDYRSLSKLKSTYVDGMLPLISEDGKIHTTLNQHVTATGRISSAKPNLQNIPIRTEDGRLIRKAFVASQDSIFVDADYSQIELKVLAHLSGDENMLNAFVNNQDIHRLTASQVFHKDMDQVTDAERSDAKAVNFGIIYGISDYGLSQDLGISRQEAEAYIEKYKEAYPDISRYMDEIIKEGMDKGYVTTILNRRRYIPELKSSNFNIRKFGERVALNTPIQGSAADIIKIAMVNTYKALKDGGFKSKLILQVHDELIIDTRLDELEEVKALLKETMEGAVELKSDISVDLSTGKSWYEA